MSNIGLNRQGRERRGGQWILGIVFLLAAVVAATFVIPGMIGDANGDDSPDDTPAGRWQEQRIADYRYTLQVSCFCIREMVRPVLIEVQDNELASVSYADDGAAADPVLFERFDSVQKLFAIIEDAAAQDPVRLDVTYDETYGVPLSVSYDIDERIADEELSFEVSDFEALD
jgi:hypothetical protein